MLAAGIAGKADSASVDSSRALSDKLRFAGVTSLSFAGSQRGPVITLGRAEGGVAKFTITRVMAQDADVAYESRNGNLIVRWRPSESFAELEIAGESFRIDFDARAKTKRYSTGAEDAFAGHASEIAIISEAIIELKRRDVFDKLVENVRQFQATPFNSYYDCGPECWSDPWPTDPWTSGGPYGGGSTGGGSGPKCTGPWVRGVAVGEWTRSYICYRAKNDANVNCWNNLCIGCCQLLECDAFCLQDDFFCITASVWGQSCGY